MQPVLDSEMEVFYKGQVVCSSLREMRSQDPGYTAALSLGWYMG